jgi:hypothetical protein
MLLLATVMMHRLIKEFGGLKLGRKQALERVVPPEWKRKGTFLVS